jgi:hypothetical protein
VGLVAVVVGVVLSVVVVVVEMVVEVLLFHFSRGLSFVWGSSFFLFFLPLLLILCLLPVW